MKIIFDRHTIDDSDVVEPDDYIPKGEYNPHGVRPWLIHNEYGTLAVVFASSSQDALDAAVDGNKLNSCLVSSEDYDAMSEAEREDLSSLGNAGEPFDLLNVGVVSLPNPPFSWVAMFAAAQKLQEQT